MSNNDDFGADDFDLEGFDDGFDTGASKKGTLGELWRNNAFVKIGVILAGLAFLIALFIIFGGKKDVQNNSNLSRASEVNQTPGTEEVSESYKQVIEDDNNRKLEEALRQNESAVPMPVSASKGTIPFQLDKPADEDPLDRWRRLQEEKIERAEQKKPADAKPEAPKVDTRTPAIQALSESMSQQMQTILGGLQVNGPMSKRITGMEYLEAIQQKEQEKLAAENKKIADENVVGDGKSTKDILLPAGTIEYAQLITEANTDVPGPILAEVLTGPFKGARLIGTFESTYNYLTLNFNRIVLDGVDYNADAVAVDPKTTLPGMATDINRRYFQRVVLPVAAEFVTGFTQALSESGTTSIIISGDTTTQTTSNQDRSSDQEVALGIATAGKEFAGIIDEIKQNNPQLIRVRAGTPMGILFVESVTDSEDEEVIGPYEQFQQYQYRNNINPYYNTSNVNTGTGTGTGRITNIPQTPSKKQ